MTEWVAETLHSGYQQRFEVGKILFSEKTGFQDMVIFENPRFGRVLVLDGVIQTTEGDEFIYHEMMVHTPLLANGAARRVLIIGGGDGGCLREVLRHPGVDKVTMVEIDPAVVDLSKEYLPRHSDGAFDNPRTDLVIADGLKYVAESDETFDVIIVDSTDPIGPGEVLFTDAFYTDCRARLSPDGILVTQNSVPFLQPSAFKPALTRLQNIFPFSTCFAISVPTYVGGHMTLGFSTMNAETACVPADTLRRRFTALGIKTRYYTPDLHLGAFALPQFILDLLD
ncbi:MAG: polyamine aminopropyltransferase [Rhodospirillales bacterium]